MFLYLLTHHCHLSEKPLEPSPYVATEEVHKWYFLHVQKSQNIETKNI